MYDCLIVGAGPAGSQAAFVLARAGLSVLVLEEHDRIGVPVHCTGIVGEKLIGEFQVPPSCIRRQVESVLVHFPSGKTLQLPTPIRPYVLDREKLDLHLCGKAREAGAEYRLGTKVRGIRQEKDRVIVSTGPAGGEETLECRLCILAVGSMSSLPFSSGISRPERVYHSAQVDVEMDGISGIELFLGSRYAPGSFAYGVGIEGSLAKLGLITRHCARSHFQAFLEDGPAAPRLKRILSSPHYRPMPFGSARRIVSDRIVAVGDAACQIKTTTGGGVYYGMTCACMLGETVIEAWKGKDLRLSVLKGYQKRVRAALEGELKSGLVLRSILERVEDRWWDRIAQILPEPGLKDMVESYRDFDNHSSFIRQFFSRPAARRFLLEVARETTLSGLNMLRPHRGQKEDLPANQPPKNE